MPTAMVVGSSLTFSWQLDRIIVRYASMSTVQIKYILQNCCVEKSIFITSFINQLKRTFHHSAVLCRKIKFWARLKVNFNIKLNKRWSPCALLWYPKLFARYSLRTILTTAPSQHEAPLIVFSLCSKSSSLRCASSPLKSSRFLGTQKKGFPLPIQQS